MKSRFLLLVVIALGVLVGFGTVAAEEDIPPHPHMLLLGDFELVFTPEGPEIIVNEFRKCVDLAANRTLRLGAHHERVHFGQAGAALREHAGNLVIPALPFGPFADCDELVAVFFPDAE